MWWRINKIRWTIWSWPSFAITIWSIRQRVPPPFKWWRVSHQLCLWHGPHTNNPWVMQVKKCRWSHNLMKKGGACGSWPRPSLKRRINRTKDFVDKSRSKVSFEEGDEVWLNIKNFRLPEGLNHKFLNPYVGPFKVSEKKFPDTYKLKLRENLKVHPTFHVSFLKPISCDASRRNREHNSRPPPNLIHNELEFEVEVVLKSRQLRGWEREYLVKWKGYHPI